MNDDAENARAVKVYQNQIEKLRREITGWMFQTGRSLRHSEWETLMAITSGIGDIQESTRAIRKKYRHATK